MKQVKILKLFPCHSHVSIKIRKDNKIWGMVTSQRALDAALVLDYPIKHEAHFLCDRDAMPACAHVAQFFCLQVLCVAHTRGATCMSGCAHTIPAQTAMVDAIGRAISATHPSTDARRTSTAHSHKHSRWSRTPAVQQRRRGVIFSALFCQHAATALPRLPRHTPSCCALLYRGRALSMRPVQDAPRSQRPPGPPAMAAFACIVYVCVCWVM
jgi:hypothetical protein